MEKKILTESKRNLIYELGEMIKNASDQELFMMYGILMGMTLAKPS